MPIAYSCPHCGKQYSVAEQYAGQTGPCAACGQPITIPAAAPGKYDYAPQPGASGGGGGTAVVVVALVVLLLLCPGVLIALLLPAVQAAREAARRTSSQNNLKQLVIGLHNYHDTFGTFPPAVVTDANGQPLYSGRVLLLPFIEQKPLYDQFDLTQAWDSPRNLPISQQALAVFQDPSRPSDAAANQTDYLFVTGAGTVFEGDSATKIANIPDGTSNTLVMVEVRGSGVAWAEPRDNQVIDFSQPTQLPQGNHPGINLAAMADGSVRNISQAIDPPTVRSLATRDGQENVTSY